MKRAKKKDEVKELMKDEKDRKLFVGGLGSKVKSSHLKDYFSKFGEICEVRMIRDPKTK